MDISRWMDCLYNGASPQCMSFGARLMGSQSGARSAQMEDMILIKEDGIEVLTEHSSNSQ